MDVLHRAPSCDDYFATLEDGDGYFLTAPILGFAITRSFTIADPIGLLLRVVIVLDIDPRVNRGFEGRVIVIQDHRTVELFPIDGISDVEIAIDHDHPRPFASR